MKTTSTLKVTLSWTEFMFVLELITDELAVSTDYVLNILAENTFWTKYRNIIVHQNFGEKKAHTKRVIPSMEKRIYAKWVIWMMQPIFGIETITHPNFISVPFLFKNTSKSQKIQQNVWSFPNYTQISVFLCRKNRTWAEPSKVNFGNGTLFIRSDQILFSLVFKQIAFAETACNQIYFVC